MRYGDEGISVQDGYSEYLWDSHHMFQGVSYGEVGQWVILYLCQDSVESRVHNVRSVWIQGV
jgi:hypothetical protein